MSAEEIATAFIQHYYTTLNANPSGLAGLYVSNLRVFYCTCFVYNYIYLFILIVKQPQSTLTLEGNKIQGAEAIVARYAVSYL